MRWVSAGAAHQTNGGRFEPFWFDDDDNDLFTNSANSVALGGAAPALPSAPTNFTLTQTDIDEVTITWTKGAGADDTIIRCQEGSYPTTVTDGYSVYDGALETTTHTSLSLGQSTYYYRAWSENATGYSTDYAQGSIGGSLMTLLAFVIFCGGISLLATWRSYYPLKLGAGLTWLGFFAYWLSADVLTDGSPEDVIVMFVIAFLSLLFLIWGATSRSGSVEVQEEQSSGGILKRINYSIAKRKQPPAKKTESIEEYRAKIRKAARKKNRR
jgi:hypothetical protein